MKKLLLISAMALMCANTLQAQVLKDTIYYNEDWDVVGSASDASFFRLYDASDKSEGRKPFKDFLTTGDLRNEGFYLSVSQDGSFVIDGPHIVYDDDGDKVFEVNYKNNIYDGRQLMYKKEYLIEENIFENGVCQKAITYKPESDSIEEVFSLISRQVETFTASRTIYYSPEEYEEAGKIYAECIYNFDPEIWEYPFELRYIWDTKPNEERPLQIKHGKYQEFDHQGRIVRDGQYKNDERVGKWKYYRYDGGAFYVIDFDSDSRSHWYTMDGKDFDGPFVCRYNNGRVKMTTNFKNGFEDGQHIEYDTLGRKTTEFFSTDGRLNGTFTNYWYDDDPDDGDGGLSTVQHRTYVDGKLEGYSDKKHIYKGTWITMEYGNYLNGNREGAVQFIKDNGVLVICNFKNDVCDGDYSSYNVEYVDDILNKDYTIRSRGQYRNGDRVGLWTFYNYDDRIYWIYDYDSQNSPTHYYNLDGKPFTGTLRDNLETDDPDDDSAADTAVIIIKKSLIQRVDYINSKTGKVIATDAFKKGVKVE